MRKLALFTLLAAIALHAFGHAGEVHKYMGTVTAVHADDSFELKKTDGQTMRVSVAAATVWQYADGRAATRAELAAGKRVVVTIATDGKTATLVKFAAAKKN